MNRIRITTTLGQRFIVANTTLEDVVESVYNGEVLCTDTGDIVVSNWHVVTYEILDTLP